MVRVGELEKRFLLISNRLNEILGPINEARDEFHRKALDSFMAWRGLNDELHIKSLGLSEYQERMLWYGLTEGRITIGKFLGLIAEDKPKECLSCCI